MQETKEMQIKSLSWENLLEKELAAHSSILAWKIASTEEPGGPQSMGSQRVVHDWATEHAHTDTVNFCVFSLYAATLLNSIILTAFLLIP